MNVQIEESWKAHLEPEFEKDYFRTLTDFVKSEYSQYQIFPPGKLIFNAFNLCPFDKVKVVIIGQDPYHGPGQAHGLCFSVESEAALEAASANAAAYGWYFRLIARMIAANEATGLAPAEAKRIAVETIRAAAEVALASDAPAEDIIAALATPGGITAQGLEVLEKADAFAPWDGAFAAVAARVKGG